MKYAYKTALLNIPKKEILVSEETVECVNCMGIGEFPRRLLNNETAMMKCGACLGSGQMKKSDYDDLIRWRETKTRFPDEVIIQCSECEGCGKERESLQGLGWAGLLPTKIICPKCKGHGSVRVKRNELVLVEK